ncbi:hypothetical protein CUR21_02240 [Pseudorhodobacter sp. MZDSW-24AT]|nr:hypothetical protein CUR21_02240 [Pseudorhodobacter sp. MZDSW-24AT]
MPINHGTAAIRFNGLTITVGFDIHAETPVRQKEELIREAALQCVSDFFDAYRGGEAAIEESEAA